MAKERILIADDEPDVLDVARFALELQGYQVQTAGNGLDAVEQARREPFDLFLTDVKMPVMDGLDAFRQISENDPSIVGVAMTGYGTMQIAVEALKQGFAEFVVKPFDPDDLTSAIARSLEKDRLRHENTRLKALIPLFELSNVFMTETSLASLLDRVAESARKETSAERATLLLAGEDGRFDVAAHAGGSVAYNDQWRRLAEWVLRSSQPLILDSEAGAPVDLQGDFQGLLMAIPLSVKERPLGVLFLDKPAGSTPFGEGDAELLSVMAGQASVAIENARLFEERDRAYQELEKIDHLKSEFIKIAAHELRTPLSLVLGYSALLEEECDGAVKQYVQHINQNAMRLRSIVDDMTNLRYLELHQAQLNLSPTNLRHLIEQAQEVAEASMSSNSVEVELAYSETLGDVMVDVQKIELVLSNLLSNAFKFSPPDGTIRIAVRDLKEEVVLSIGDQGPGIPAEEQVNIWKRFYQVEESLTRSHEGIGLGLAIVKGMVELHQGRVWVESAEGQGSTFYFAIPNMGVRDE